VIDPRTFKIYNAGGGMLLEYLGAPIPTRVEIPLYVEGEADGSFDSSDSITFYGFSYPCWENNVWTKNYYENKNIYWLTWAGANGKRMVATNLQPSGGTTPHSFHKVLHFEEDHEISDIDSLDYRDQLVWSFSEVGSAPWTNGYGLVKQAGERDWADYNLSLNSTRVAGSKGMMVMVRVQGPNAFYVIFFGDNDNKKITLCKVTPANTQQNLQNVDWIITTNETYIINISVTGNNIKCFINGSKKIDYNDNSDPYLYGNIGLNVHYDTVVDFWDIKVNGTTKFGAGFFWHDNFTSYPLRSNAYPVWTNLQGTLGDMTVRIKDGYRVYETTTECLRTSFELGSWNSSAPAKLRAWVKGEEAWKEPDDKHRTTFYLNGYNVLDYNWTGYDTWNAEVTLANSILKNGTNILEFDLPGNDGDNWDYQSLNWMEIDLWKNFVAYNGYLDFNHSASMQGSGKHKFVITNFSTSNIQGYKIYNFTYTERIINPVIILSGSTYKYEFSDTINMGEDRYIIVEAGCKLSPISIERFIPKGLNTSDNDYDYILITHEGLYDTANPNHPLVRLANHRAQKNELNVTVVTTQEIYDEFSNGLFDPTAIRNFLKFAYDNWVQKPTYVLFAGDASNAYKLAQDRGMYNVPTHLEKYTSPGDDVLASDNWLCCVSGEDLLPDLIPGRLPFASISEAESVVDKIITCDNTPNTQGWRRNAVFHADDVGEPWEVIFKQTCQKQVNDYLIPNGFIATQEAYLDDYDSSVCNDMVKQGVNNGCMLLQYSGHGSPNGLECFHNSDIVGLTNKDKYPFTMSMGCSTGKFDMPTSNSFCEEIILAADKGGIASWGPSRTAYATIYEYFHYFSNNVFTNGNRGIGTECYDALINKADTYHLYIMTFFGDPAMDYGLPFMDINLTTNYRFFERDEDIVVHGQMNTTFSGTVNITIRDPELVLWKHILTTVTNGMFNAQFHIPSAADYGTYRLIAFAWDGSSHQDGLNYIDIEIIEPGCNPYICTDLISFSPEPLMGDRTVDITAKVENRGTRATGDFKVQFFVDEANDKNMITEVDCLSIGRDSTRELSIIWDTTGIYGSRAIFVKLDPLNLVAEYDESDNLASKVTLLLIPPKAHCGQDIISYRYTNINFSSTGSISPESEITNYTWDFGDGNKSYVPNPVHAYTLLGTYNVTLTINESRNFTDIDNLTVFILNRPPKAYFEISQNTGYVTTPFTFNSSSYDHDGIIVRYHWDFGDGMSSSEAQPTHYYPSKGDFSVNLTIFDNDGGNDTYTEQITIKNLGPRAVVEASHSSIYTGVNITFYGNKSSDPDDTILNYTWTFGIDDYNHSCIATHSFQYSGVYNVSLVVTDPSGKLNIGYIEINVMNRAPGLNLTISPINGTIETEFTLSIYASDPDGYISRTVIDFGDKTVINKTFYKDPKTTLFQYSHHFTSNKNKTISAYVIDNDGLKSETKTLLITIENLLPIIDLGEDKTVRVNQMVFFSPEVLDKDGEVVKFQWDFDGDGKFDAETTQPEASYIYTEPGNYIYTLRVWDNDQGSAEDKINITVIESHLSSEEAEDDGKFSINVIMLGGIIAVCLVAGIVIFLLIRRKKLSKRSEINDKSQEPLEAQAGDGPTQEIKPPSAENEKSFADDKISESPGPGLSETPKTANDAKTEVESDELTSEENVVPALENNESFSS